MNIRDLIKLFTIIITILILSLIIGNSLMTPILAYHKFLVKFFGWFFLSILIILIILKFNNNFKFASQGYHTPVSKSEIWKKTLLETFGQIIHKAKNFMSMVSFLLVIGAITILIIWLNSRLINIPVY